MSFSEVASKPASISLAKSLARSLATRPKCCPCSNRAPSTSEPKSGALIWIQLASAQKSCVKICAMNDRSLGIRQNGHHEYCPHCVQVRSLIPSGLLLRSRKQKLLYHGSWTWWHSSCWWRELKLENAKVLGYQSMVEWFDVLLWTAAPQLGDPLMSSMRLTRFEKLRRQKLNQHLDLCQFREINFQNRCAENWKSSRLETLYLRVAG